MHAAKKIPFGVSSLPQDSLSLPREIHNTDQPGLAPDNLLEFGAVPFKDKGTGVGSGEIADVDFGLAVSVEIGNIYINIIRGPTSFDGFEKIRAFFLPFVHKNIGFIDDDQFGLSIPIQIPHVQAPDFELETFDE